MYESKNENPKDKKSYDILLAPCNHLMAYANHIYIHRFMHSLEPASKQ